ncbi:hypothetical protein HIM_05102 [Hirsutella minnesotensis 3608]|uniref:RRM domain-containing protein n=1 Tax=Hirsutella minnesotensis 3608 TaxID=1043627 RepID=A0A0F8A5N5_9HYPO|nr:hypothetical protein HIM_05102 [Hirsutella minnesotensis 3608]
MTGTQPGLASIHGQPSMASQMNTGPSGIFGKTDGVAPAGIPQSQSCGSILGIISPSSSHGADGYRGNGYPFSPASSRSGNFTEPRSYAPRASALSTMGNEPPPKFDPNGLLASRQAEPVAPAQLQPVPETLAMIHATTGQEATAWNPEPPSGTALVSQGPQTVRSRELQKLTNTPTGLPLLETAMSQDNFPFIEAPRMAQAVNHGVVKLRNIPFSTKRAEVIAFLGRNSKILNDADEPVHIIMERVTSKTMDAYVEFVSLEEAMKAVDRHHHNIQLGRVGRLGDRPVDVELSSQASLMKDLFPLARGLIWDGVTPQFKPFNPEFAWENFRGFISEEEMVMLIKHVEVPHRSPYSKDCPQRPYECLISTLKKFPWYATDSITISQRHAVYIATERLLQVLAEKIGRGTDPMNLTPQLQARLTNTAMACPGFTPLMKDNLAWMLNVSEMEQRFYGQPLFAHAWRHQYSLAPKPGMPLDVIEWYISAIREQTHRDLLSRPHASRTELQEKGRQTDMHWGYFWAEVGHGFGPHFDQMTLAQAAQAEFSAVERILSRALPQA